MEKVKVAVIGCGVVGSGYHIPSYIANNDCEIVTFCDIIPERAEAMVEKYGVGKATSDYHEIVNDPTIEAVSVCTPNNTHSTISIDLLRAGKDVLCEKPTARNLEEALLMQEACHRSGKVLNIGVVNRFDDSVRRIKALIDAGELGEIYQVYCSFRGHRMIPGLGGAYTTKQIAGGGVLIDWGVHFLDLIMYCCGDPEPKAVFGHIHNKMGHDIKNYTYIDMWAGPPDNNGVYDVEDFVTAIIKTKGPVFTINGAWAQNIGADELFIDFLGDKAGIRMQYRIKERHSFILYSAVNGALLETIYDFNTVDKFQNEIDAFVRCVRTGEKLPSHIDNATITARMLQAIYDSSEKGKEIVL